MGCCIQHFVALELQEFSRNLFWSFCSRPLWSIIFDMLTQEKHFIAKPGQIPQWFCSMFYVPEVVATKWLLEIFVGPRSRCLMGPEIWFDHFVALALGLGAAFCRGAGSGGSDRSYKSLFQPLHVNWKGDIYCIIQYGRSQARILNPAKSRHQNHLHGAVTQNMRMAHC